MSVVIGHGEPCRNCKARPEIVSQSGHYKFLLRHPRPSTCPRDFWLEAHDHSADLCRKAWSEFNTTPEVAK